MKIIHSDLQIDHQVKVPNAQLYFIENIVIVEVDKHATLGEQEVKPLLDKIQSIFKCLSKVHYISNRTEVYSLKPAELPGLKTRIDQFKSYSVVTYGQNGETNLIFERMFLKKEIAQYNSIHEAITAVKMIDNNTALHKAV